MTSMDTLHPRVRLLLNTYTVACRKGGIKMDFMKKLRVGGAATFQIRTPRV